MGMNILGYGRIKHAFSVIALYDSAGSASAGYTIVEGSGLPHISVIGFQREVDWPTLVSRLKAATEGNGPVIK